MDESGRLPLPNEGIRELRLFNFKSWGGHFTIGPFATFTSVIGPNGSGKSNLMDAISFVLGVKTIQLRGNQLTDLIHRKPINRDGASSSADAADGMAKGGCFVELVFGKADGINLLFRRTISAAGKATYSFNGRNCTWVVYESELRKLGILVRARNFLVFQGDVESIAHKSPSELTELIEQISGSAAMRDTYKELEEASIDAETSYLRSFEKRKHLSKEKRQIKEQKEEAERYQEEQRQRSNLQQQYFLWQLLRVEQDLNQADASIDAHLERAKEAQEKVTKHEDRIGEAAKDLAVLRKQSKNLHKKLSMQTKEVEKAQAELIATQEQAIHATKSLTKQEEKFLRAEKQLLRQQKLLGDLEEKISGEELRLTEIEELNASDEGLQLEQSQVRAYEKCKLDAERKTAGLRQQLEPAKAARDSKIAALEEARAQIQVLEDRRSQAQSQARKLKERVDKMQKHVADSEKKVILLQEQLGEAQQAAEAAAINREELSVKLEEVQRRVHDEKADRDANERADKLMEAVSSLQRLFRGVRGRVVDLCRPIQRRYDTAVSTALGKNLDAIVVDDKNTALECIRYLKEQRVGTATFIPTDSIAPRPVSDEDRQLGGSLKLVLDVIQYEDANHQAMLYACGSTLVCDHLSEARSYAFQSRAKRRHKVVTLRGEVIEKSGNMTGGQTSGLSSSTSRFDEQKSRQLKAERDALVAALEQIPSSETLEYHVHQLTNELSSVQNALRYSCEDVELSKSKLEAALQSIDEIDKSLHELRGDAQGLEAAIAEESSAISKLEDRIFRAEDALFSKFSKEVGVRNIREYEAQQLSAARERSDARNQAMTHLARLKSQRELERNRLEDLQAQKGQISERMTQDRSDQQVRQDGEECAQRSLDVAQQAMQATKEQAKELDRQLEQVQSHVQELKTGLKEVRQTMTRAQTDVSAAETAAEQLQQRRGDLLQTCRLEQVEIPMVGDAIDFDGLTVGVKDIREFETDAERLAHFEQVRQELEEQLDALTVELESAAPNLKAIEKFSDIKDRLKSTAQSFDEAKSIAKAAADAFAQRRQERLDLFTKAFEHVKSHIDGIYKNMTRSARFPMGGSAYLSLENPEDPFSSGIKFHATPPMKRFRDMEQLSGGEKTVAALALLFAIHSFRPAPFFVLDEVDAALDNANVNKVASYIRSRAQTDGLQFVVISLKDALYDKADALVGIYKNQAEHSSGFLTLDLSRYEVTSQFQATSITREDDSTTDAMDEDHDSRASE